MWSAIPRSSTPSGGAGDRCGPSGLAYRRHQQIESGNLQIAVVVQQMVEAEFAGVMFTANPVTGAGTRSSLTRALGRGRRCRSGHPTTTSWTIRQGSGAYAGPAEVVIHSAPGGGVTHSTDAGPGAASLPDPVLTELAALGRSVATHFGRPQDIEWAYDDGRIWLVQARPMTALPPPPPS